MKIIPAIDIIEGKCVRLTKGDFSQKKIYNENPVEVAKEFEDAGLERLHLVDLDGAREGKVRNWKVLESLAGKTSLQIDFGGGINSEKDLSIIFDSGALWATIGSLAVREQEKMKSWIIQYGADKFFLGADVREKKLAVKGWTEMTEMKIGEFIAFYLELGLDHIFCTDISRDGLLEGPATELYKELIQEYPPLRLVASGGVSGLSDLEQLIEAGCYGVIIGKAIYEGRINVQDLKKLNQ